MVKPSEKEDTDLMDTKKTLDRPLVVAGLTVLVLVLVAVLVIVFRPEPIEYDPATPEGVVQTYVRAVLDEDDEAAAALLVSDWDCEVDPFPRFSGNESVRISLGSVEYKDDRAFVEVRITTSGGSAPFDRYEWTEEDRFILEQEPAGWRIDSAPWRFMICMEEKGL